MGITAPCGVASLALITSGPSQLPIQDGEEFVGGGGLQTALLGGVRCASAARPCGHDGLESGLDARPGAVVRRDRGERGFQLVKVCEYRDDLGVSGGNELRAQ